MDNTFIRLKSFLEDTNNFEEINFKSKMFDMDVDTIFKIRGERLGIG